MLANMERWGRPLETAYLDQWASQLQVREYWTKLWSDFQQKR
jgi:hypothetical protein